MGTLEKRPELLRYSKRSKQKTSQLLIESDKFAVSTTQDFQINPVLPKRQSTGLDSIESSVSDSLPSLLDSPHMLQVDSDPHLKLLKIALESSAAIQVSRRLERTATHFARTQAAHSLFNRQSRNPVSSNTSETFGLPRMKPTVSTNRET